MEQAMQDIQDIMHQKDEEIAYLERMLGVSQRFHVAREMQERQAPLALEHSLCRDPMRQVHALFKSVLNIPQQGIQAMCLRVESESCLLSGLIPRVLFGGKPTLEPPATFLYMTKPGLILRAVAAAALCAWVFETPLPSLQIPRTPLVECYRRLLSANGGEFTPDRHQANVAI